LQRTAYFECQSVIREKMSMSSFWADIDTYGCTWTILLPMMAELLRRTPPDPADRQHALRRVVTAPVAPYIDELTSRFGFEVTTVYGTTEIGTPFSLGPDECNGRNAKSCGRAASYIEYRVVDENDVEVAPGEAGELVVRGRYPWVVTQGYVSRYEDTVRAWRNGWFHTGDLLRLRSHDGQLEFIDRRKDAIRRRGENISSMEVEAAIQSIPGVSECGVIGVPSDLGEEDVMAVIALDGPASPSPSDVREALTGLVPGYAVPRYVRVMSQLPRTEVTLRVQKSRLRQEGVTPDTWDAEGALTPR
jgi:crotonobetaine/carnitine-CoA ligase